MEQATPLEPTLPGASPESAGVPLTPSRGRYRRIKRFRRGQVLKPTAFGDVTISVNEVLGSRP